MQSTAGLKCSKLPFSCLAELVFFFCCPFYGEKHVTLTLDVNVVILYTHILYLCRFLKALKNDVKCADKTVVKNCFKRKKIVKKCRCLHLLYYTINEAREICLVFSYVATHNFTYCHMHIYTVS